VGRRPQTGEWLPGGDDHAALGAELQQRKHLGEVLSIVEDQQNFFALGKLSQSDRAILQRVRDLIRAETSQQSAERGRRRQRPPIRLCQPDEQLTVREVGSDPMSQPNGRRGLSDTSTAVQTEHRGDGALSGEVRLAIGQQKIAIHE